MAARFFFEFEMHDRLWKMVVIDEVARFENAPNLFASSTWGLD